MPELTPKQAALDLINYIEASPTATHATIETIRRLELKGYKRLDEKDKWDISQGDKFFVTRNDSSVIAVHVGTEPFEDAGFRIVGAHTDFPGLRLKPNGVYSKQGYIQLGVEIYGGPILHTWLDRDLGIAGKLVFTCDDGTKQEKTFAVKKPVCRIPNLAPHIRIEKKEEIKFNKQDHMPPVIGMGNEESLTEKPLLKLIARSAGVDVEKISSYTLEVFDLQTGVIGGMNGEFIFVRAIDNLAACHAGLEAFLDCDQPAPFTSILALFDNEEVGSQTMQGAGSRFLDTIIERLTASGENSRENYFRSIANSLIISNDGAHAVNPNYPEAHEPRHHPVLNGGPVIKINANQRYTSHSEALEHLRERATRAGVPLQEFVARTDVGTGSTIGPMTSTRLGIRSVDVGSPMISMHSSREMGGVDDQLHMIKLLREHYKG